VQKYGTAREATDNRLIIQHKKDVICVPGYQGKEHTHNIEWLFLIAV
jgi:hypothetical protein